MEDETKNQIQRKVSQVQRHQEGHGKVFRVLWVIAGVTIVLVGLALTVFPGPAVVVIPVGLAMLAAEFAWARRLLIIGIEGGVEVKHRLENTSPQIRLLGAVAVTCLVGAVVALILLR
jgi:uncharacterized protein (TIGR02611 family)